MRPVLRMDEPHLAIEMRVVRQLCSTLRSPSV